MSDQLLGPILSALISAVILAGGALLGKRMELKHLRAEGKAKPRRRVAKNEKAEHTRGATELSPSQGVSIGQVLRHTAILQLGLNGLGLLAAVILGFMAATDTTVGAVIMMVGTLGLIIGFWLSGSMVAQHVRWLHLLYVASGTLLVTLLLHAALLGWRPSTAMVVMDAVGVMGTMVLAGVLLSLLRRDEQSLNSPSG